MEEQMDTLSAAIMLFFIMDPFGNIPVFFTMLKDVSPKRRFRIMVRELWIALGVLLVFLLGGQPVMGALQLRTDSISIAGGVILFLIGIRMIFPPPTGGVFGHSTGEEPFIVPLAIPGVAGPSALAVLMFLTGSQPARTMDWFIALVASWIAVSVVLLSSMYLFRWLGKGMLTALERLMGMLLIALSVQLLLSGVIHYLHQSL